MHPDRPAGTCELGRGELLIFEKSLAADRVKLRRTAHVDRTQRIHVSESLKTDGLQSTRATKVDLGYRVALVERAEPDIHYGVINHDFRRSAAALRVGVLPGTRRRARVRVRTLPCVRNGETPSQRDEYRNVTPSRACQHHHVLESEVSARVLASLLLLKIKKSEFN